jgi:dienelactone hydrolase
MRVQTEFVDLPREDGVMRVLLARPADDLQRPALVFSSDIFQLTESTQRAIVRFDRAALSPRVKATALFYPTGLHDGDFAGDGDAGSLARANEIRGPLLTIFGSADPHTDAAFAESIAWFRDAGLAPPGPK